MRERRTVPIAASLATGRPVSLRDAIPGLDPRNPQLVTTAIRHAAGQQPLDPTRSASRPDGPLTPWVQREKPSAWLNSRQSQNSRSYSRSLPASAVWSRPGTIPGWKFRRVRAVASS